MLVIISDLHFVDGTAGKHNLPFEAFESVFLSGITGLVRAKKAKELRLVLLGDTFDLIRTSQWFEEAPENRPWGEKGIADIRRPKPNSRTLERCLKILGRMPFDPAEGEAKDSKNAHKEKVARNTILYENWDVFKLLRGLEKAVNDRLKKDKEWPSDVTLPVRLVYVPGNHDRLVNLYPALRDEVMKILKPDSSSLGTDGWFHYLFSDPLREDSDEHYGVCARHGQEFDGYNYAGGTDWTRASHLAVPIGDPLTTEFAARIPYLLIPQVEKIFKDRPELRDDWIRNLQDVDNIRPLGALIEWLHSQVQQEPELRSPISEALQDVVVGLLKIGMVRSWALSHAPGLIPSFLKEHLWNWEPFQSLRIKFSGETVAENVIKALVGGNDSSDTDSYAKNAFYDYKQWRENDKQDVRVIVYGHTHDACQIPLNREPDHDAFYINSGTWRPLIHKTIGLKEACEFVSLKHMTYLVFYRKDEDLDGKKPGTTSFDVWNGFKEKKYA